MVEFKVGAPFLCLKIIRKEKVPFWKFPKRVAISFNLFVWNAP